MNLNCPKSTNKNHVLHKNIPVLCNVLDKILNNPDVQGPDQDLEAELSKLLFQMTFLYFEHPSQV